MNSSTSKPSSSPDQTAKVSQTALSPGDEAAPGTPGTGEDLCQACSGTGKLQDGKECPACSGTGKVTRAIGGG
jgi:DnaJ-class molecular chaperone